MCACMCVCVSSLYTVVYKHRALQREPSKSSSLPMVSLHRTSLERALWPSLKTHMLTGRKREDVGGVHSWIYIFLMSGLLRLNKSCGLWSMAAHFSGSIQRHGPHAARCMRLSRRHTFPGAWVAPSGVVFFSGLCFLIIDFIHITPTFPHLGFFVINVGYCWCN